MTDPAVKAWEQIQAGIDAHEEFASANHELIDAAREARGFAPINWGE